MCYCKINEYDYLSCLSRIAKYRGGKSRFTFVRMEKDMQVIIITIALLITIIIRKIIQINSTIINK
jgi:hypothetical protein